jgi:branched-chain amino acid transport system permease protein
MRTGHFKESLGQLVALSDSKVIWGWVGAGLIAALVLPQLSGNYTLTLCVSALIAVVGAVGLNILTGTTGLISLGQSGFLAVGAYTNAILMADYGLPFWIGLPAAGFVASTISILVGIPSLRLRGIYLAITTLAFSIIVTHIILYTDWLTHGPDGIFIPRAGLFGFNLQQALPLYYLTLAITIGAVLCTLNLSRTRVGRAWMAIRDHDIAARAMGINLVRYKLMAFAVSSFWVGVAGGLMSLQIRFINTDVFSLLLSIEALAMIILGGLGSVPGAILGAVFISFLPEAIRLLVEMFGDVNSHLYTNYIFEIRGIAYGVVIVAFLRFKPEGLIGVWRDGRKYWSNWPLAY